MSNEQLQEQLQRKIKEDEEYITQLEESENCLFEEAKALKLLLEDEIRTKEKANEKVDLLKKQNEQLQLEIQTLKSNLEILQANQSSIATENNSIDSESAHSKVANRLKTKVDASSQIDLLLSSKDELTIEELKKKLIEESELRKKIQEERDSLYSELEDLSQSLFEESNKLVSSEAKRAHELLQNNQKLEKEIDEYKKRLELEVEVSEGLKSKLHLLSNSPNNKKPMVKTHSMVWKNSFSESLVMFENEFQQSLEQDANNTSSRTTPSNSSQMEPNTSPTTSQLANPNIKSLHYDTPIQRKGSINKLTGDDDNSEHIHSTPNKLIVLLPQEVHNALFKEFEEFVAHIKSRGSVLCNSLTQGTFGEKLVKHDLHPCLKCSKKSKISLKELNTGLLENLCFIEPLLEHTVSSQETPVTCALCVQETQCKFRFWLASEKDSSPSMIPVSPRSSSHEWKLICSYCRNRVVTVADFYSFLRNIRGGIFNSHIQQMYKECLRLRIRLNVARLIAT